MKYTNLTPILLPKMTLEELNEFVTTQTLTEVLNQARIFLVFNDEIDDIIRILKSQDCVIAISSFSKKAYRVTVLNHFPVPSNTLT